MSIKTRLSLLVGALLLAFLAVLQLVRHWEHGQTARRLADSAQANQMNLQLWIDLTNQPLLRFGQDFSTWDELAGFVHQPRPAWAEANLHQNLSHYQIHALWIFDSSGQLVYSTQQNQGPALPAPPLHPATDQKITTETPDHYHIESRDGLLEIWIHPIRPATSPTVGWLAVARLWDDRYLNTLSQLAETRLKLSPARSTILTNSPGRQVLALPGPDHQLVRWLQIQFTPAATGLVEDILASRTFIAFGLLVIIAVWLGLRQWVAQPLVAISESLRQENPATINPLLRQKNELGQVAQLVDSSFRQKADLVREIEQRTRIEDALRISQAQLQHASELRARLARDLHDGIIQSIYAAGLGLESAVAQLDTDVPGARQRFLICRQSLNDIIREVRSFITGLEPDQSLRQNFSQALAALVQTMQALWPVKITPAIDEPTAQQLTAGQEVHLLQITRECISNALRHGEARFLKISLFGRHDQATYEICDDGHGFDQRKPTHRGNGLHNLSTRAREMGGATEIVSVPGKGTTVTITFPLHPATI